MQAIATIARHLIDKQRSFKIITPYDAQRNTLQILLRSLKLPWENKVFNVDSFQGNEDDEIVVSVVRTEGLGFLQNERRVNVMLTRCKGRMWIVTSRDFVEGPAKDSLVGRMVDAFDPEWLSFSDGDLATL